MLNILLSGVGGQGTVLASKIIAKTAIARGETAHTAETIGMAQRGGCVVSHVRIGEEVYSPLIPKGCADVIIAFEPAEAVRVLPYLKENGTIICSIGAIKPVTDSLSSSGYEGEVMITYLQSLNIRLINVDNTAITSECGAKSLNIGLLGAAAAADVIGISSDELKKVVEETLPAKYKKANLRALEIGIKSVDTGNKKGNNHGA